MPTNTAAYLVAPKTSPLEVKSAPYTAPREDEIVIKNRAVAVNPVDWMVQGDMGSLMFPWLKFPLVSGSDSAGEVVEVGSSVTRFKVGDRVVGHAVGQDKARNSSSECSFQIYTVLLAHMASPIPSTLSYEKACVIPLGLSTAACGLFQQDMLALRLPSEPREAQTDKTVLIWGGSSSVGSSAIQLAVAAGYEVITTCSPRNFEYVKRLGACEAFDYNSKTVKDDVLRALKDKSCAGAFTVGLGAAEACLDIIAKCDGDKAIAMATYPAPPSPPDTLVILQHSWYYLRGRLATFVKAKTRGIRTKYIFGTTLAFNGVGKAMYEDFLPKALAAGTFVCAPDPQVVGTGLEMIQTAYEVQKKGVSATKVVVSL
ncbi:hypothetical protein MMC19_006305 [Ptychographa xylographoides]|nr:hypothetical protein [Ptychographa xylographoides]